MAAPTNCREFLDLLRSSGVVPDDRLNSYLRRRHKRWKQLSVPGDAANQLLADGFVSEFQAQQLLRGKHRGFWIKKYLVLESLGGGGMSRVVLCEQTPMSRLVAMKILPESTQPGTVERFLREARAVAALNHPNIIRAIEVDQEDRFHFLVMEYVDGASLQDLIDRHGRLETGRACHYVAQAAMGLQHAHEAGWVHRDVKPGNLLVDRNGVVKILDLGLARMTADANDQLTRQFDEHAIIGTADYLAPEQSLPGQVVDARADLYSLGVTLYFLLTGKTPFGAGSALQKIVAHQVKKPRPITDFRPDLPKDLTALIEKMMAKSPSRRPQTAREVGLALRPLAPAEAYPLAEKESAEHCPRVRQLLRAESQETLAPLDLTAPAPTGVSSSGGRSRRRLLLAVGGLILALLCTLGAGASWWLSARPLSPVAAQTDKGPDAGKTQKPEIVPGTLAPAEAARNLNSICTVQMVVRSTGLGKTQNVLFLNSEVNYRANNNFTVVVQRPGRDPSPELDALQARFQDKTIRVTGKVTQYNQQRQIIVTEVQDIEIVTEPSAKK